MAYDYQAYQPPPRMYTSRDPPQDLSYRSQDQTYQPAQGNGIPRHGSPYSGAQFARPPQQRAQPQPPYHNAAGPYQPEYQPQQNVYDDRQVHSSQGYRNDDYPVGPSVQGRNDEQMRPPQTDNYSRQGNMPYNNFSQPRQVQPQQSMPPLPAVSTKSPTRKPLIESSPLTVAQDTAFPIFPAKGKSPRMLGDVFDPINPAEIHVSPSSPQKPDTRQDSANYSINNNAQSWAPADMQRLGARSPQPVRHPLPSPPVDTYHGQVQTMPQRAPPGYVGLDAPIQPSYGMSNSEYTTQSRPHSDGYLENTYDDYHTPPVPMHSRSAEPDSRQNYPINAQDYSGPSSSAQSLPLPHPAERRFYGQQEYANSQPNLGPAVPRHGLQNGFGPGPGPGRGPPRGDPYSMPMRPGPPGRMPGPQYQNGPVNARGAMPPRHDMRPPPGPMQNGARGMPNMTGDGRRSPYTGFDPRQSPYSGAESAPPANMGMGRGPPGQRSYPQNSPGVSSDAQLSRSQSAPDQPAAQAGSQPPVRNANPDALPSHPVPVRPGLTASNTSSSMPAPVRQMTNASVATMSTMSAIDRKRLSQTQPVTRLEIDRLQSQVNAFPQDQKLAYTLATKLAEAATVLASNNGTLDTKATEQNAQKYNMDAHRRLKRLANSNYPDALYYLGTCYSKGLLGLTADAKEAFGLYQSAGKLGHADGSYRTALSCELGPDNGGGTRLDPEKAVLWCRRAAQLNNQMGMYKLGVILLTGALGERKSIREAETWLARAAERADKDTPHALQQLGLLYDPDNTDREIRAVVSADPSRAREMFERGADLGLKSSQARLGMAYEYGQLGLATNNRLSISWYTQAAAQGDHTAELALSGWYLTGCAGLLEESPTEAFLWARKAAISEPPMAKAMFAMGYYAEQGIGCQQSMTEAKKWYGRSAFYKFPKALEKLDELKRAPTKPGRAPTTDSVRLSRKDRKKDEAECVVM